MDGSLFAVRQLGSVATATVNEVHIFVTIFRQGFDQAHVWVAAEGQGLSNPSLFTLSVAGGYESGTTEISTKLVASIRSSTIDSVAAQIAPDTSKEFVLL
jgi:hypothetical protein